MLVKVAELSGSDLDRAVFDTMSKVGMILPYLPFEPSRNWRDGGPLIQSQQIYLEPPHDMHALNYDSKGKPKGCWMTFESWHATVSARTRTWKKSDDDPALMVGGRVGRGEGDTALIASMRAFVESVHGEEYDDGRVNVGSGG